VARPARFTCRSSVALLSLQLGSSQAALTQTLGVATIPVTDIDVRNATAQIWKRRLEQ
jgi:hypothetical protein